MYVKNWKTRVCNLFNSHILTKWPCLFPLNVYKELLWQTHRTAGCVCCFLMNIGLDTKRQQMFESKPTNCLWGILVWTAFSGIEIFFLQGSRKVLTGYINSTVSSIAINKNPSDTKFNVQDSKKTVRFEWARLSTSELFLKGPDIFGFVGHKISVATTPLCPHSTKTAIGNM